MADIRLIAVPYELGRLRDGVGLGPEVLLEHGAEQALAANGARVATELIELDRKFDNEIDATFALAAELAERVRAARAAGALPVILSGSCFAAVGVVAGLDDPAPGVVWFDAHGDFNEPTTSPSGYLDGMGLSVLTGSAWEAMLASLPGARALAETAVVLAGARDFDDAEAERLDASRVAQVAAESLRDPESLLDAVGELEPRPSAVYLHLDLDVLDLDVARVNRYASAEGSRPPQLERVGPGADRRIASARCR